MLFQPPPPQPLPILLYDIIPPCTLYVCAESVARRYSYVRLIPVAEHVRGHRQAWKAIIVFFELKARVPLQFQVPPPPGEAVTAYRWYSTGPSDVPGSACGIVWDRWEQPVVAVCGVTEGP